MPALTISIAPAPPAAASRRGPASVAALWRRCMGSLLLPLVALVALLALGLLAAPVRAAEPAVVVVEAASSRLSLDGRFELREDRERRLTPDELLSPGPGWQAAPDAPLNLGHSPSAWWLRMSLSNPGPDPVHRLLQIDNPRVDRLDVHLVREGGEARHWVTGDRLPYASRPVPHHAFVFPIELRAGETVQLLLRVDSHDGYLMLMPMSLLSDAELQADTQRHTLLMGLYYGGLGLLLLYHLCLLGSTREPSFATYVAYLGALIACRVHFEGHAAQYLFRDAPWAVNQGLLLAYSASVVLFGLLLRVNLREFLATRPGLRRTCLALIALNALPIPLALAGHYALTVQLINPTTLLGIVFALGLCAAAWRQGWRHTRWFLAGAGFVLLGLLAERLRLASVLPDTPLFAYAMALGSVLEALCVAVALADAVNRLKADKLAAEQLAREAESRLNEQLGALVQERTLALEAANDRLARLAITDELTGAHNRRHFDAELAQALAQSQRGGGALGLCLFDIDHFKGYNDRHGHPAGDEVLRTVTLAVMSTAKRASDQLFRIGGEEFALLMAGRDQQAMLQFVEQLRAEIEALGIAHAGLPAGVVTASFGLAWCPAPPAGAAPSAGVEPQALYRFADALLYRAKAQGRNRVMGGTFDPSATSPTALAELH